MRFSLHVLKKNQLVFKRISEFYNFHGKNIFRMTHIPMRIINWIECKHLYVVIGRRNVKFNWTLLTFSRLFDALAHDYQSEINQWQVQGHRKTCVECNQSTIECGMMKLFVKLNSQNWINYTVASWTLE